MKLGIDLTEFTSIHKGGKDEVAYNILKGFTELGHSYDIVCFCSDDLSDTIHKISPEIEVCIIPKIQINHYYIEVLFGFVRKIIQGFAIKKALKRMPVDVILFTNKMTPWMRYSIPTVMIPHDIQVFLQGEIPGLNGSKSQNLYKYYLKLDFLYRDYIIAISDYDKEQMCKYIPWSEKKLKRIYNPIFFKSKVEQVYKKKYITALNIQWAHKNIGTLIKSYSKIADQINYDLLLIGRKPFNFSDLEKLVIEAGISDRVHFTGYISDEELLQYLGETRVYVNPSYFEGFGMTAVEMMGQCIPTIVAATTATPEVTQGLCRYYEPADNVDALAKEILDELVNPTPKETLNKISEQMREIYSYKKIASEYWEFLDEICKNGLPK